MPFEVERCIVGTVNYLPFLSKIRERRRVCVTDGCIFDEKNGNWSGFRTRKRHGAQLPCVIFVREGLENSQLQKREGAEERKRKTVIPSDSV